MPTPSPGETEQEFMGRCMGFPDMQQYEPSQRAAICHSKWDNRKETEMDVKKNFSIEEYKEIGDDAIQIMASDETVDRDSDVIMADGWSTANWLKSGSLLYGHQPHELPVGSAESAQIIDKKLVVTSKLAKKGTSEWHDAIRSLVEQKILRGVSVGFQAKEWVNNDQGGKTFIKQELLEVSLTPIPANPSAKVLVKSYSQETQDKLFVSPEEIVDGEITSSIQEQTKVKLEQKTEETEFLNVVSNLKKIIGE